MHRPSSPAAQVKPLIDIRHMSKTYPTPSGPFPALRDVSLQIETREFVTIVGKSGSGKSTLLNVITGIDRPSAGEIIVAGTAVHALRQTQLAIWRGRTVGVVFQFFQLLPTLTIAENLMLPMELCNSYPPRARRVRALDLLARVGIAEQADKLPAALSGGQQQRAAIARALANDPPIVVADEPTGNLDSHTAEAVLDLFASLVDDGKTVVLVTHERDLGRAVTRTITIADGVIASNLPIRSAALGVAEVAHA
jgi:putative ABC transport system ATP-binding protein